MHFYHLIFDILDASRMNEHIFKASKIYENIFYASTLLLKRRVHFWKRRVHFGRVVKIYYNISMLFLTRREHVQRVHKDIEL